MKIVITLNPFGKTSQVPLEIMNELSIKHKVILHPMGAKRLDINETKQMLFEHRPNVIVADTEIYDENVLKCAPNLGMISRGGIGTDSVDLEYCKKNGIIVTNTPDAPSRAVAELTICQMINMLRKIREVDHMLVDGKWNRYIGRELGDCCVGIIGYGRIGKMVADRLKAFGCTLHIYDIAPNKCNSEDSSTLETIIRTCDIITLHIPLVDSTIDNHNFITYDTLKKMKPDVRLLNLSRGGIINEEDLFNWLNINKKATAAIDTFQNEEYRGKLRTLGNAYLTPHLGSCTVSSRNAMEIGAITNAKLYVEGKTI